MHSILRYMRAFAGVVVLFLLQGCQTMDAAQRTEIDYAYVVEQAQALAAEEYEEPEKAPEVLRELDYDAYRDIRFNPLKSLWQEDELPFRIQFFHPGYLFTEPVDIYEFTENHVQELRFSGELFDYGKNEGLGERLPSSMGYAGFRVLYELNKQDLFDELAVFLGASYFRVLGRDQVWGLSCRGLAIDTGMPKGEEFPRFQAFWLRKPEPDARELKFFALLNSPSVAGAYEFLLVPGEETRLDVTATLFFRRVPERIGMAPFSSMFLFGENTLMRPPDFRPEVHDSDGLLIQANEGEYIWRPLVNEARTRDSLFAIERLQGYGLLQRDRDFASYQDIEAVYHMRPSAWVEPEDPENWGTGQVFLFEINTRDEAVDNIATMWLPDAPPTVGEPFAFSYSVYFRLGETSPAGRVTSTRIGKEPDEANRYEVVVDFAGEQLAKLSEVDPVEAQVDVGEGATLEDFTLKKNPFNDSWRLVLYITPENGASDVEMRAFLKQGEDALTETWAYRWPR